MKPVPARIEEFLLQLKHYEEDVLEVILFDRKLASPVFVSANFEIIKDDNSLSGDIAGFKLRGAKNMLLELCYTRPSIGLVELVWMFKEYNQYYENTSSSVFGEYEDQVINAVQNSLVVWNIPK